MNNQVLACITMHVPCSDQLKRPSSYTAATTNNIIKKIAFCREEKKPKWNNSLSKLLIRQRLHIHTHTHTRNKRSEREKSRPPCSPVKAVPEKKPINGLLATSKVKHSYGMYVVGIPTYLLIPVIFLRARLSVKSERGTQPFIYHFCNIYKWLELLGALLRKNNKTSIFLDLILYACLRH